ncbi:MULTISPECIES: hypothetical protein [unclassified Streptomyces]|uniref:hypothetical protein n=1 Tax=unclassified Streptomyces TaxID=2593676 RepID=UPI002E198E35|nr:MULTISPECIES: hypothetical protein [unclassified Streptomyces]
MKGHSCPRTSGGPLIVEFDVTRDARPLLETALKVMALKTVVYEVASDELPAPVPVDITIHALTAQSRLRRSASPTAAAVLGGGLPYRLLSRLPSKSLSRLPNGSPPLMHRAGVFAGRGVTGYGAPMPTPLLSTKALRLLPRASLERRARPASVLT